MVSKYIKRCSTLLIFRELKIKNKIMGHRFTSTRMTIIKKARYNKCWRGCKGKAYSLFMGI